MKSTLHDVHLTKDDPELVELCKEGIDVVLQLTMFYFHYVFVKTSDGIRFIYRQASSEPIPRLQQEFQSRIAHLINPTIEELCFVIANYILDWTRRSKTSPCAGDY